MNKLYTSTILGGALMASMASIPTSSANHAEREPQKRGPSRETRRRRKAVRAARRRNRK